MNEKPSILLLEDLTNWQDTITRLLKLYDYDVSIASSLQAAKTLVQKQVFDVAIVDIRLEEGDDNNFDGIKFLDVLENYYADDRLHVIMLSGHATTQHAINALERPSRIVTKFYLKEEFNNEEFISEIARALRISKAERAERELRIFRRDLSILFDSSLDTASLVKQIIDKPSGEHISDFNLFLNKLLQSSAPFADKTNITFTSGNDKEMNIICWSRRLITSLGVTIRPHLNLPFDNLSWESYGTIELLHQTSTGLYDGIIVKLIDISFEQFLKM